ncbi:MAG: phosphoenolpyruvate--protein phosphotransferase [Candidatus Aadella gelida]|nr:phosphoenolpyruvate--protein phosphotransferase [Candidatus Aadella gelida]
MKTLKGISAASGIIKGVACRYIEKIEERVPHYIIDKDGVELEVSRLDDAYSEAKESIKKLQRSSRNILGKIEMGIFNAHSMILQDETIYKEMVDLIGSRSINAEHAAYDTFNEYADKLKDKNGHFSEITHDIVDVRDRLITSFSGMSGDFGCSLGKKQPVVIVAKRLTPSMVLNIPREHVLAFVTEEGGFTTHATILARNYGVPIILNVDVENNIKCGDKIIVDGSAGKVIISPDKKTNDYYSAKIEKRLARKELCRTGKDSSKIKLPFHVKMKANISTLDELKLLKDLKCDGIGLLRSEFLFSGRDDPPSEEEWFAIYREIFEKIGDKPVIVRLIDIGGDKLPGYLRLPPQDNPDLGIRGARAIDMFKDVYLSHVKGLLRAAIYGNIRVLFPMVADVSDILSFRSIIGKAKSALRKKQIKFRNKIKEGVMIETPAAVVLAENILKMVDFANIGSNDLIQYTLAAARGDQLIEKRYHILHPALVKQIEQVVKAGKKLKKEICLCGEIAGFEEYYPLLLSTGLRSFSVESAKLEDITCQLLHEKKPDKSTAKEFYKLTTKHSIDRFFKEINR